MQKNSNRVRFDRYIINFMENVVHVEYVEIIPSFIFNISIFLKRNGNGPNNLIAFVFSVVQLCACEVT